MTNNFRGFTLAEVLITLGIIGVIAALVMPALTTSIETSKIETSLSKAVNTMKNANMQMALENEDRAIASSIDNVTYIKELAKQVQGAKLAQDGNTWTLALDDGVTYINNSASGAVVNTAAADRTRDYDRRFMGIAAPIIVDINGSKGPNLFGRDRFSFLVDGYGEVIAIGGVDYNNFNDKTGLSTAAASWITTCKSDKKTLPTKPEECTASVVENGYKVLYAYKQINK